MIAKDLKIEAIDPAHFANFSRLMDPPSSYETESQTTGPLAVLSRLTSDGGTQDGSEEERYETMPVVVLTRNQKVLRVFKLGGGTFPNASLKSVQKEELRAFRKKYSIPFLLCADIDALPDLWAGIQKVVDSEDDMVAQCLCMLRVLRQALGKTIFVEPRLLGMIPLPSYDLLKKTFDLMLPDGKTFVFYIVDGKRIWSSVVVSKNAGDIQLITSHQSIENEVSFSSIRTDAKAIVGAVQNKFGPPHIGVFLPLSCWAKFVKGDRSAIARAMANRQAVVDPAPPWLLALVGAGAVTEAASRSVRLAGKLLAKAPFGSKFFSSNAGKWAKTASNPLEALGVDPWETIKMGHLWTRRVRPLFKGKF